MHSIRNMIRCFTSKTLITHLISIRPTNRPILSIRMRFPHLISMKLQWSLCLLPHIYLPCTYLNRLFYSIICFTTLLYKQIEKAASFSIRRIVGSLFDGVVWCGVVRMVGIASALASTKFVFRLPCEIIIHSIIIVEVMKM